MQSVARVLAACWSEELDVLPVKPLLGPCSRCYALARSAGMWEHLEQGHFLPRSIAVAAAKLIVRALCP